jgi:hypothetical protein
MLNVAQREGWIKQNPFAAGESLFQGETGVVNDPRSDSIKFQATSSLHFVNGCSTQFHFFDTVVTHRFRRR